MAKEIKISVRIDSNMDKVLKKEAMRKHLSVGQLVRLTIREYLNANAAADTQ